LHRQNRAAENHAKPPRRRQILRLNLRRKHEGLFLIIFTLQIANDRHRIFFGDI
jgi:hypothetical protein